MTLTGSKQAYSPLFMVMDDPALNQFISYLTEKRVEQEKNPDSPLRIELSAQLISAVHETFKNQILDGERHLHYLCHVMSSLLLGQQFELHSNVIGVLPDDDKRPFLIRELIDQETLFSTTDIDLGQRMLDHFRYTASANDDAGVNQVSGGPTTGPGVSNKGSQNWLELKLSANFVEYVPFTHTTTGVNRITSRVKAEEELTSKLVDEIFAVDEIISRDKQLRKFSKFIKDIFGLKIVCEDEETCQAVFHSLHSFTQYDIHLSNLPVEVIDSLPSSAEAPLLAFVETKDYLSCEPEKMKKSGWKAIKSVVNWCERLFEIQIQPLSNYYLELDHMAGPSHRSFKLRREMLREKIAERVPLYSFYQDLVRSLFAGDARSFEHGTASVIIR